MLYYYPILFIMSLACCMLYLSKWNKRIEGTYSFFMVLIAVSEYGAYVESCAKNVEIAYLGNVIQYSGACFLQIVITFCILSLCQIKISKNLRAMLIIIGIGMYGMIFTDSMTHMFYKSVTIHFQDGVTVLTKEYGPLHNVFYVMVIGFFVLNILILLYSFKHKKDASVRNIFMLFLLEFLTIFLYFAQKFLPEWIDLTCLSYVLSQIIILVMLKGLSIYDVDGIVTNAMLDADKIGCFSFSLKGQYLGCNNICKKWLPELTALRVDMPIKENAQTTLFVEIKNWIRHIDEHKTSTEFTFHRGESIYRIEGGYFTENGKILGYQFAVRDYTKEQKYLDLMNNYNAELENEVEKKTNSLREMHEKMILNMADMVESRDNNTGHHIKRTSQGVRILISKILEDNKMGLDDKFCKAVIKAAPMHDLGKIAVEDSILRKPARFTDEEFEIMKSHTTEGAKIVHKLLMDTQDDYFASVAENVAHYHHERMDGRGYPCGLKGEEIPLEARIMAIADVYDALVSKRCYKESMSFEQSFQIILDGMGNQFDEQLLPYLLAARPELEKFYTEQFKT